MKLGTLINHAHELAAAFKEEHRGLVEVFELQLPKIGLMMRNVDYFIYEQDRYRLQGGLDTEIARFPYFAETAIQEACEEMERAAGTISAYSRRYEQEARK